MGDATLLFELLLRDYHFMNKIDGCIDDFLINSNFELKHVPQLVLLIVELLQPKLSQNIAKQRLSQEETTKLFDLYCNYILSKIVVEIDIQEFTKIYNTCVKLAFMKLKFTGKSGMFCICR